MVSLGRGKLTEQLAPRARALTHTCARGRLGVCVCVREGLHVHMHIHISSTCTCHMHPAPAPASASASSSQGVHRPNPNSNPNPSPSPSPKPTQGVLRHGVDDWATIRTVYLPHRDEAQLRDTWENKLCPHAR